MSFFGFARRFFGPIFRIFYWVRTENKKVMKESRGRGLILCSNHTSYVDPVILGMVSGRNIRFMGKEELFKKKYISWFLKKLGAFPVSRGSGDTGAIDVSVELIKNGEVLGIFPEGNRGKCGELRRLKSGTMVIAAQSSADIIPVIINCKEKIRMFRKITVRFGDVIKYEELGIDPENLRTLRNGTKIVSEKMTELYDKE